MSATLPSTESPVLLPSSSPPPFLSQSSPLAWSSPSSPLGRLPQSSMYSNNSNHQQYYQHGDSQFTGLTPYQYTMVMQPIPVQQMPVPETQDHAMAPSFQVQGDSIPQVVTMEDLKSIPCPYLKNKGHCRFDESRCRYTHNFAQGVEEDETEGESSFDKLQIDSTIESPQTQNTTPPQAHPDSVKNSGHPLPRKPNFSQPSYYTPGYSKSYGRQQMIQPAKITLNPPSKLYTAYEAEKLPEEQVYRVINRKSPVDESILSYVDEATGQHIMRSDVREIRFDKPFGKVFDSHLQSIIGHTNLAQNLSYLSANNASGLSDETIFQLGIKCNPKVIILTGAINITDAAFLGLCINCKGLEYLEITGYDNKIGRLTSSCLRMLLESSTLAPFLKEVVVKHQAVSSQVALELSRARPSLAITTGTVVPSTQDMNIFLWCSGNLAFVNNFVVQ